MKITKAQRRFEFVRTEDQTGVSGIGIVAEGCLWSDGTCSVRWLSECASFISYTSVQAAIQVHGHGGRTTIKYLDPPSFMDYDELFSNLEKEFVSQDSKDGVRAALNLIKVIMEN